MENLNLDTTTPISAREKQVLHLIAHERKTKEIAHELFVSYETAHSHRKNLMKKLNARNTAGLIRIAFETGIFKIKNKAAVASFVLTILMLSCTFSASIAQSGRTCGQDVIHEHLMKTDPTYLENRRQIEERTQEILASGREQNGSVISIPIVFHIFHNGDAVGSGENLSDAIIQAQLDQLNDDFRRTNSDVGNTPSDFTGVAADTEIQFCLAEFDPNGAPTTGINRYNINDYGGDESQCWNQSYLTPNFVAPTIWDRDLYLNYYSFVKVNGAIQNDPCAGLLGYAFLPGTTANRDAVVCVYSSLGSIATPNPAGGVYGKGRTGTHEVGHWLNLSHIWGNSSTCAADDGVVDTHPHGAPNYTGAPCTYPGPNTCGAGTAGDLPDMFQNYMDYSTDDCMNLFTTGQKDRMLAAITASRPGLLTSPCGCMNAITVSSSANSGPGSLREAVARICVDGVITIDAGLTIDLTSPIEIMKDMTIRSSNSGVGSTISGGGVTRLFNITGAFTPDFNAINFTGGNDSAISLDNAGIYMFNCNFYGNSSPANGGAVNCTNCNLVFYNVSFYDNVAAANGGAIVTIGTTGNLLTINTTFYNNTANNVGGAIASFGLGHDMTFNFNTFYSNTATTNAGGAIYEEGNIVNSKASIYYGNTANSNTNNFNIVGTFESYGSNLFDIGGGTNIFNSDPSDLFGADPAFGSLVSPISRIAQSVEILPWGDAFDGAADCLEINTNAIGSGANGVARPSNDACDIGAYEHRATTAACDALLPLTCGASVGDLSGTLLYLGCGVQNPAQMFEYTPQSSGNLNLSLHSFTDNLQLFLYDNVCGSTCPALASSINPGNAAEMIDYTVTAGTTYYILVWGADNNESTYSLDAVCPVPPLACDNTLPIFCGEIITGTNAGLFQEVDVSGDCIGLDSDGAFFGYAQIYSFTPLADGDVTIDLTNIEVGEDLDIILRNGSPCDEICLDVSADFGNVDESITYSATVGEQYYIIVRGWERSQSTFNLSLACTDPCEEDIVLVSPDDDIPGAAFIFPTNKSIYATNKITGVSAVDFSAGPDIGTGPTEAIHLNSGFEVGLGAVFHAYMDGCGILSRNEGATGSDGPKTSKSNKK